MARYLAIANSTSSDWDGSLEETGYEAEIKEYWERIAKNERFDDVCADIGTRSWERVMTGRLRALGGVLLVFAYTQNVRFEAGNTYQSVPSHIQICNERQTLTFTSCNAPRVPSCSVF